MTSEKQGDNMVDTTLRDRVDDQELSGRPAHHISAAAAFLAVFFLSLALVLHTAALLTDLQFPDDGLHAVRILVSVVPVVQMVRSLKRRSAVNDTDERGRVRHIRRSSAVDDTDESSRVPSSAVDNTDESTLVPSFNRSSAVDDVDESSRGQSIRRSSRVDDMDESGQLRSRAVDDTDESTLVPSNEVDCMDGSSRVPSISRSSAIVGTDESGRVQSAMRSSAENDAFDDTEESNRVLSILRPSTNDYVVDAAVDIPSMGPQREQMDSQSRTSESKVMFTIERIRLFILGVHATGCYGFYLINLVKVLKCLSSDQIHVSLETIVACLSDVMMFAFCAVQFLFIITFKKIQTVNDGYSLWLIITITANVCHLIDSMFTSSNNIHIERECQSKSEELMNITTRFLHNFVFGYFVLSLGYICGIWDKRFWRTVNAISPSNDNGVHRSAVTPRASFASRHSLFRRLFDIFKFFSNPKYSFIVSLVISLYYFTVYTISSAYHHLFTDPGYMVNKSADSLTHLSSYTEASYYYIMAIIAFFGFLLARVQAEYTKSYSGDDVLLLIGVLGHTVLILFEMTSVLTDIVIYKKQDIKLKISFTAKAVSHLIGLFSQSYVILKYSAQEEVVFQPKSRGLFIRAIVVFLAVSNTLIFLSDCLLPPLIMSFMASLHQDVFGFHSWWLIVQAVLPVVAFSRIQSAILCYKVILKFKGMDMPSTISA